MISADLRFHPIGQGCFYTGELFSQNAKYRFVYDCGSNSIHTYIDRAIVNFRRRLGDDPINLLIVSHYDYDHVNKIRSLITGKHVKRLIIPYVETIERLLIYTKADHGGEDYRTFLNNPLKYFADDDTFNIDEIIVIGASEDKQIFEPYVPIEPTDPKTDRKIEFNDAVFGKSSSVPSSSFFGSLGVEHSPIIRYYQIPFQVLLTPFWEFRFYLKERSNQLLIDSFNQALNTTKIELNIGSYEDMFRDDVRTRLRQLYENKFRDLNSTSLVVYSGPIGDVMNSLIYFSPYFGRGFNYPMIYPKGTLLTGDINLNQDSDLNDITNYFRNYLPKTSIFQVPHHGSQKNWNFNHPNNLDYFSFYIINHGIGRKHHPSVKVVSDIDTETEGFLQFNNEVHSFIVHFQVL